MKGSPHNDTQIQGCNFSNLFFVPLQEMVKSVNATDVLPKDRLSDKVLFYNQQERRLELATEREEYFEDKTEDTQEKKELAEGKDKSESEKKEDKSLKFSIRL